MIWQTLSNEALQDKLKTDKERGLSSDEAELRITKYGANEITHKPNSSIIKKFINQFNDYMIIILMIAAVVSLFTSLYENSNDYTEPIVIIMIVIINAVIGIVQEERAERAIDALKKLTQPTAMVIRDGIPQQIKATELVCGDLIMLKTGDFVPADARIIKCNNLQTDESALTGESLPVNKFCDGTYTQNTPIADIKNMVWSATAVTGGNCTAIVVETGMSTQVGQIAKAIIESESPQTPLQAKLEATGKILGTSALIICGIVFVVGIIKKIAPLEMFMTSVSLAVAAIPEGLPAIVTIMLALGIQKMAKKNAIVKKLPAVETLGSASVICSDKTGTLTQNKMTVTEIYGDKNNVISNALICSNNSDSTERAVFNYANIYDIHIPKTKRIKEIPFSSKTKYMATINKKDGKYLVAVKGAPDIVLKWCNMSAEQRAEATNAHKTMTDKALRVIAVAIAQTDFLPKDINIPLIFCGLIGISDPPRPEIKDAVRACKKSGIKPVMITGDYIGTACAVAREIGMTGAAITSTELNNMTDGELKRNIKKYSVFARVTPEHKVRIVKAFQANGEVVAMTGDGVNDAPALKQADIGCAMGITGTDVAKGAADMILTDDNFATIVEAVHEGRCIYANVKKAVHFLLSSNIGEILTIFCAIIAGLPSPLSAVQLLWVNLITDSIPAISLGVDTNNKDIIMSQKPIKRSSGIFSSGHGITIFLEGLMIGTLALIAFCMGYYKFQSQSVGQTMAFCVLSMSQLVHAFNVRSEKSIFSSKLPKNKLLFASLFIGIILQICVVTNPILSGWFGTVFLNIQQWQIVALLSITPVVVVEISKLIYKR